MFKLAVFSDEVSQDLAEAIAFAKEFKIGGLSIRSVWNKKAPQNLGLDDAKKVKQMCDDAGLRICEVATPFYKCDIDKPDEINQHQEWLKQYMELASLWDTKLIRVFTFWKKGKYEEYRDRIVEQYAKPLQMVENTSFLLCVENEASCFVGTGRQTHDLLNKLDHPNLRIAWDPCNVIFSDEYEKPFPEGYRLVRDKMVHMHLKDAKRGAKPGEAKCVEVGTGEVDYRSHFRGLIADKYEGWISLETHWRVTELSEELLSRPGGAEFTKDAKTASKICMQNIQRIATEAGAG